MTCYVLKQAKSVSNFGFTRGPYLNPILKVLKWGNQANKGTQRPRFSVTFDALKWGEWEAK